MDGTYLFFAIASRIPFLCLLASLLLVLIFSASIAFEVQPMMVEIASSVIGLLMAGDILAFYVRRLMVRVPGGVCTTFEFLSQWRGP
jgi:hypothetical protein